MMSEHLSFSSLSPDEYQQFVASTQVDMGEDWQPKYADWIRSESVEFLGQHGPGALLVMPESFGIDQVPVHDNFPELNDQMIDELGDLVWFGFGVAEYSGIKAMDACKESLEVHDAAISQPLNTFEDLTQAVSEHADKIRVANKLSIIMPEADDSLKMTSLRDNPFYVLQRTVGRLCRALDENTDGYMPPTMSDLEAPAELSHAIGDYINALAYVASVHLHSDIQTAVSINMQKLKDRALHGKK